MASFVEKHIKAHVHAAPLAVFRIFFGTMMLFGLMRFASYGWIEKLYIAPKFFFSYYGFEWVKPLGNYTYLIFICCALSAVFVAIGYKYRLAILMFFLSFTYIELMDKTTYLNHYYFTSIVAFLMIFLPANAYYSVDALKHPRKAFEKVPAWTINSIKLLLAIVYFYAGLAKLNSDWLIEAMPLKIWLPAKFDIPLIGDFMHLEWVQYAFSWGGALYDLSIPFFLLYARTRPIAFIAVVVFHLLTWVLFPIGMFPYIMIVSALIFFDARVHRKLLGYLDATLRKGVAVVKGKNKPGEQSKRVLATDEVALKAVPASSVVKYRNAVSRFDNGRSLPFGSTFGAGLGHGILIAFFILQLLVPFRYLLYPGELFWTEEGYRFSWRVMLMEKSGYAQFKVIDGVTGKWFYVDNSDFLTPFQEKQMAFQADFILEYAHFLKSHFEKDGFQDVAVYVDNRVSLNGRLSTPMVDPEVDLTKEKESFSPKKWILPFTDEIRGI